MNERLPWFLLGVGAVNALSATRYPVGSVYDEEHARLRRYGIVAGLVGLWLLER